MGGFNFGVIGNIVRNAMDTDRMDIGRRIEIENPDGSLGETMPDEPIYTDMPCHISFNSHDNPDPLSVDTKPIIVSITIHCSTDIDLQNNDYIYAKKLKSDGTVMETYAGVIGFPQFDQSGQSVIMTVSKSGLDAEEQRGRFL